MFSKKIVIRYMLDQIKISNQNLDININFFRKNLMYSISHLHYIITFGNKQHEVKCVHHFR